jgi:hypothetical protein
MSEEAGKSSMNRHQRRAASKPADKEDEKKLYGQTCDEMLSALLEWLRTHPGQLPRFAMPPKGVAILGCIDEVADIVAKDDAARQLVDLFCAIGVKIRPNGQPTILMLNAVLDAIELPYEVAPVADFAAKFPLAPLNRGGPWGTRGPGS